MDINSVKNENNNKNKVELSPAYNALFEDINIAYNKNIVENAVKTNGKILQHGSNQSMER